MKIAIIGAGPAGLAALATLSKLPEFEVVLFDRGKHHNERDHEKALDLGIGIGGAGLFSDGKFSFFPSGTEIYKLRDKQLIRTSHDWICSELKAVGIQTFALDDKNDNESKSSDFLIKEYPSSYGSLEQRKKLIDNLAIGKCNLFLNCRVDQINKEERRYIIKFFNEKLDKQDQLVVDAIILATGRLGNLSIPKLMPDLKLARQQLRYEIGIRIETKANIGFLSRRKNPDVKAIWKTPFGEVRTFCTCRNGEVWNIPYGDMSAISGRSDGPKTSYSNFGLLVRFTGNSFAEGERHFNHIVNSDLLKQGNVGWQSLTNFLNSSATDSDVSSETKSKTRPWFPKEKFKPSTLISTIGKELHAAFCFALGKLVEWSPDLNDPDTMVLFPAIEGTGVYPALTDDLRIIGENIWCVGDLAGKFRGIIPAFISGHYAAHQAIILEQQNRKVNDNVLYQANGNSVSIIHKLLRKGESKMAKIGVGAIIVRDGKVLLGKRLGKHGTGTWSFPGGHLEEGESPDACAVRETREETGLEISRTVPGPWTNDVFAEGERFITLFVISQCKEGAPKLNEPDKFQEWTWFDWDKLPSPLFKPIENLLSQGFDKEKLFRCINAMPTTVPVTLPTTASDYKESKISQKANLQYKAVSFDLDGTIIVGTTSTLHFADLLGVRKQVEGLEDQLNKKHIDSTIFMNQIGVIMKGLTKKFIKDNLHTLPIIGGLAETVKRLNEEGIITLITTTSNHAYADAIKEQFGFQHAFGTEFEVHEDGSIGKGIRVCSSAEKIRRVRELTDKHGIAMEEVAAIGDSYSDIPLFSQVGLSIALNYEECLQDKAKVYLNTKDIREILPSILVPKTAAFFTPPEVASPDNSHSNKIGLGKIHYMQFLRERLSLLPSHDVCALLIKDFDSSVDVIFSSNIYRKILPDDFVRISALLLNKPLKAQQYKRLSEIFEQNIHVKRYFGEGGIKAINESIAFYLGANEPLLSKADLVSDLPKTQLMSATEVVTSTFSMQ